MFITRASWSLVMIFSFLFIITYFQQPGCAALVFLMQALMYSELISINKNSEIEKECKYLSPVLWWWFLILSLVTYGHTFKILAINITFSWFNLNLNINLNEKQNLYFLCFIGYFIGLLVFAAGMKRRIAKYQFQRFALSHVVLLLVTAQSTALVANMFEGLIWFLLPCSLVVANDIWAFIFGFFMGRTPLISLSPKKTWEGFLGGFFATFFFCYVFTKFFSLFPLMTCSKRVMKLEYWPNCELDYPFLTNEGEFFSPLEKHMFVLALFASLMAPFGGFFASGFKRAFKIKDFGSFIPGHGGFVDRMDCQVMMGMFVFVYLNAFVIPYKKNQNNDVLVSDLLNHVYKMTADQQKELYQAMGKGLVLDNIL